MAEQVAEQPSAVRPTPVLEVKGARKVFGNGSKTVTALDEADLQVGAGESVGIVGESGSGKTTLARLLVGLETPTAGEIVIDGTRFQDWRRLRNDARRTLRSSIQTVFQDPYSSLNPMRTIGWTLREAITTHDRTVRDTK
jgi:peptide/nickel transport system ATP-binding protein